MQRERINDSAHSTSTKRENESALNGHQWIEETVSLGNHSVDRKQYGTLYDEMKLRLC